MWIAISLTLAAPPDAEATRDAMGAHWMRAVAARDAVIAGELGAARSLGGAFAADPAPKEQIPRDAWDRLRAPFKALQESSDLNAAGAAVGQIARTCAECHREHGAMRSFEPPAPAGPSAMEHHRAGAAWMWSGIVADAPDLFARGVAVLAAGDLVPTGLPDGTPGRRTAMELEVRVQDLAASAGRTTDTARRAELFGRVVATCAACHQATGGGPTGVTRRPPDLLTSEMHTRFALVTAARQAIQRGDLPAAKARGADLLGLEPPTGLTGPWGPFVADLKAESARLERATTLREAARAVSAVAIACGTCHTATNGGPTVPEPDAMSGTGRDAALDLLWLALISESDDGWARGTTALGADHPPVDMASAKGPDARASVYSVLLTP